MAYTPTNWKDRDVENPRTYTARQNEDGSITFFDAPGTINEAGTPVNAENMNKIEEQLYKNDLERKITKCITEIPQDIKLEMNDGVLTLKAGSKVYVPNGFEADGTTPKFDVVVIENDVVANSVSANGECTLYYEQARNRIILYYTESNSSGTTPPMGDGTFYNTANNIINRYEGGSAKYQLSLPLATITDGTSAITSIDQVFNGFGYIGNWGFVLPDVEVLIPNGRNSDGSLNNIKYKTQKVYARQIQYGENTLSFWLNMNNSADSFFSAEFFIQENMPTSNARTQWYKPSDNKIYFKSSGSSTWTQYMGIPVFSNYGNDNGVTSFIPKTTFHAADNNEVVHKTGYEEIGGIKTFDDKIYFGSAGENISLLGGDSGQELGEIIFEGNNSYPNTINLDRYGNCLRVFGQHDQTVTHAVLTNQGISKSANGYVKLGNGIIIQWGRYDYGSNSAGFRATITFPTAFTSTNYSFSLIGTRASNEDVAAAINCEGRAKTTTSIVMQCSRTSGSSAGIRYIDWIAIGY